MLAITEPTASSTMMKPKTRHEMLRLVESIREKLDLALTPVALREAGASQQRADSDLAIRTFREESKRRELPALGATEALEAFREAHGKR